MDALKVHGDKRNKVIIQYVILFIKPKLSKVCQGMSFNILKSFACINSSYTKYLRTRCNWLVHRMYFGSEVAILKAQYYYDAHSVVTQASYFRQIH